MMTTFVCFSHFAAFCGLYRSDAFLHHYGADDERQLAGLFARQGWSYSWSSLICLGSRLAVAAADRHGRTDRIGHGLPGAAKFHPPWYASLIKLIAVFAVLVSLHFHGALLAHLNRPCGAQRACRREQRLQGLPHYYTQTVSLVEY
jgi:hypothetical protein